jgi:hypothetical protein
MVTVKTIPWSDEVAILATTETPADVLVQTAAVGTGTKAARDDHKHNLSVGSPVALDGVAANGTGTSTVRADHKHALGPLAALLDFNKYQAQQLIFHQSAGNPTTPAKGQVWYDTADDHVKVCTVA